MTGDPATQEWREPLGESISARLRRAGAELGSALNALAAAEKHENCAWRGLAEKARAERDKARAQLVEANSTFLRSGGQIYVARTDAGACVLCGGPIRRGQAVEVASTSTTTPEFHHCFCLIPGGES